jgi:hypothetical protein
MRYPKVNRFVCAILSRYAYLSKRKSKLEGQTSVPIEIRDSSGGASDTRKLPLGLPMKRYSNHLDVAKIDGSRSTGVVRHRLAVSRPKSWQCPESAGDGLCISSRSPGANKRPWDPSKAKARIAPRVPPTMMIH